MAEYRRGNATENSVQKVTGLNKATDVTLKRGVIGMLDLYQWLDQIRNGDQTAYRTVLIHLQSEDHNATPVLTWKLLRARSIKTRQRTTERQGDGRGDGGTDPRLRAPRDDVDRACRKPSPPRP